VASGAGGSGKSKGEGGSKGGDDADEEFEIVKGLSGDEVDAGNIIAGGRAARRGRAQPAAARPKYTFAAENADEDSW